MTPAKIFPAKELKNKIGTVLSMANREPVGITRNGHFSYVIVSVHEWENIQKSTRKNSEIVLEKLKKKDWGNTSLFGVWADRDDMADPVAYVQNLRKPRY